jgi:hypothetical protein
MPLIIDLIFKVIITIIILNLTIIITITQIKMEIIYLILMDINLAEAVVAAIKERISIKI